MSTPGYLAWPSREDVQLLLDSCAITSRLDSAGMQDRLDRAIAEVVRDFEKETRRRFIPERMTLRYDGNGSEELEVDEMTALETVAFLDSQGNSYGLSGVTLIEEDGRAKSRLVMPSPNLRGAFPAGSQNIAVTGWFGYGESIPEDAFEAVAAEAAFRIAQEVSYRPIGRVASTDTGTTKTSYRDDKPWMTGWREKYKHAIRRYRRPTSRRNRSSLPPMI